MIRRGDSSLSRCRMLRTVNLFRRLDRHHSSHNDHPLQKAYLSVLHHRRMYRTLNRNLLSRFNHHDHLRSQSRDHNLNHHKVDKLHNNHYSGVICRGISPLQRSILHSVTVHLPDLRLLSPSLNAPNNRGPCFNISPNHNPNLFNTPFFYPSRHN